MFASPDKEWRRLTEHYAGMYDEELLNLARDSKDLTEMAQQVLRDEIKKRGLGDPTAPRPKPASLQVSGSASRQSPAAPAKTADQRDVAARTAEAVSRDPRAEVDRMRFAAHYSALGDEDLLDLADDLESLTPGARLALKDELAKRGLDREAAEKESVLERAEEQARNPADSATVRRANYDILAGPMANSYAVDNDPEVPGSFEDGPLEYTWKTELCTCDEVIEARQLGAALTRAGIENWVEYFPGYAVGILTPRVFVPADRLEEAKAIAAKPIPSDIIEDSQTTVPEYEMPKCPKCHAADPVLIDTEPSNKWLCESCGNEWAEPVAADAQA